VPRLERETFSAMALMLTLMQRDHKKIANLEPRIEKLEQRNIVNWVINNPKISVPLLALVLIDTVASNIDTVLKMLGL
jgi:hypothetical protein